MLDYNREDVLDKIEKNKDIYTMGPEHDCGSCHLYYDCKYYERKTGMDLCGLTEDLQVVDSLNKLKKNKNYGGIIMKVKGFEVPGVIKVENARVYGMEESIIASGYPKAVNTVDMDSDIELKEGDIKRARYLGRAAAGSGHDCYLKGILVQFDLQLPEYIWRQLNRYHHIDFVSSQSKMHKILELDIEEMCNKYVTRNTIIELNHWIYIYNNFDELYPNYKEKIIVLRNGEILELTKENVFNMIVSNTPSGLMLTARMTTNYLQLKSMIGQREHHKMKEWIHLTDWFKSLPLVEDIVLKK